MLSRSPQDRAIACAPRTKAAWKTLTDRRGVTWRLYDRIEDVPDVAGMVAAFIDHGGVYILLDWYGTHRRCREGAFRNAGHVLRLTSQLTQPACLVWGFSPVHRAIGRMT
jgi:hypothetical protein